MAAFDYATAAPLVADMLAKKKTLSGAGEQVSWALENSACASTISVAQVNAATNDLFDSIQALADYIATLAPQ